MIVVALTKVNRGEPTILKPIVKKMWPTRLAALLFILLIILGNIWIFQAATGHESPAWLANLSGICVFGLLILFPIIIYLNSREMVEEDE